MVAVKARDADAFLNRPDPAIDAVLVYGPDQGLVAERTAALLSHFAEDPADPFSVSQLDETEVVRMPGRLAEELSGLAFGAGKRTVVVRGAGGQTGDAIAAVMATDRAANLLVAAGDLRPSSALRKAFEAAPNAAAIPCYADDERSIGRLVDQVLSELDQTIDPEARAMLTAGLGADRLASRGEIEKLALYAGPGARITVEDVVAISADASQTTLDQVMDAMGEGNVAALEVKLPRALEAGTGPGQIMRTALIHLQALHRMADEVAGGAPAASAMAKMRPPVHFLRRESISRQLRRWREPELRRALELASEGERASRGDQAMAATAVARTLLQITVLGRPQRD